MSIWWDQMNPEYITKTGHIKLTDGGLRKDLRGYLTVLDYKVSDGRNVAFQVMPGKYGASYLGDRLWQTPIADL